MRNYEEIQDTLMESIRTLKKLDVKDQYARDEIMKGNAIQSTAKALIQLEIINLSVEKQEEKRRIIYNETNFMDK